MPLKFTLSLSALAVGLAMSNVGPLAAQESTGGRQAVATTSQCSPGFHFNQWRRCVPNRSVNDASRDALDPRRAMANVTDARPAGHPTQLDVCAPSFHPSSTGQCVPYK